MSIIFFVNNKNSDNVITLKNFLDSYISKDIDKSNQYLLESTLPDLFGNIHLTEKQNDIEQSMLNLLNDLFHSIDYKVISNKNLLTKSTVLIELNYYNLSDYFIKYLKETNHTTDLSQNQNKLDSLYKSLSSIKYKSSKELSINLIKKDGQWKIILSEELLDILTCGIYSAFLI